MKRYLTERQRLEFEEWERQDKEAQERPIKQAVNKLQRTAGELIKVQRRSLLDIADKDIFVTPSLQNARMAIEVAEVYNGEEATAFTKENPDYYPSRRNGELLTGYMARNGITICDRTMWRAAFEKFRAAGLLEEVPQPIAESIGAPIPEPHAEPELPRLPLGYVRPSGWHREPDGSQMGYDPNTGQERVYTSLEIERMSGEEYKRAFRLSIPALTKVNFGQ